MRGFLNGLNDTPFWHMAHTDIAQIAIKSVAKGAVLTMVKSAGANTAGRCSRLSASGTASQTRLGPRSAYWWSCWEPCYHAQGHCAVGGAGAAPPWLGQLHRAAFGADFVQSDWLHAEELHQRGYAPTSAWLADGMLVGSTLSMDQALRNPGGVSSI